MSDAFAWGSTASNSSYAPTMTRKVAEGMTHEAFCHAVRQIAVDERIANIETSNLLLGAKLVYGIGAGNYRGVCHYDAWHANGQKTAMIEIAATGEESRTQLAGTTIHETAHVLAGHGAGHGKLWKEACARLGLIVAEAAGQSYDAEHFDPTVWARIEALGPIADGDPRFHRGGDFGGSPLAPRMVPTGKCPAGRGSRGGKYFGPGSGRLRLWECACTKPVKLRVASDVLDATCNKCGSLFTLKGR